MVRREVVAAKVGRARARLNDAALPLLGPEEGIPALRTFLAAITTAAEL
jgi:hypothetical protein